MCNFLNELMVQHKKENDIKYPHWYSTINSFKKLHMYSNIIDKNDSFYLKPTITCKISLLIIKSSTKTMHVINATYTASNVIIYNINDNWINEKLSL